MTAPLPPGHRSGILVPMPDSPMPAKTCRCGWKRPLIGVTTRQGTPPRADLMLVYMCPECGAQHVGSELSEVETSDVLRSMTADVTARLAQRKELRAVHVTAARDASRPHAHTLCEDGTHGGGPHCGTCGMPMGFP